jgi:hypothetical protein
MKTAQSALPSRAVPSPAPAHDKPESTGSERIEIEPTEEFEQILKRKS